MQQPKKYVIDGKEYEIGHFMTSKGTKMLTRLTRLVLAPLGAAFTGSKSADSLMDSEISIDKATAALSQNLDEDLVLSTIKELMSEVRLGTGMQIEFETHFAGDMMHMLNVVKTVLEHNYGDFFGGVSGAVKSAVKMFTTQESQASTAKSGGSSSRASRR
jgi:hypothetical protein